jgi:moderate conductance mechanosensitive channel
MISDFLITNTTLILRIAIILAIAAILIRLIYIAAARFEKHLLARHIPAEHQARAITLLHAGTNLLTVIIAVIVLLTVLASLGVNIGPIIASLGVVGLALSLGAQTIIKDYIGGILILFENLFSVGDTIQVGIVTGTVEEITLRTTSVRDYQGKLFIIPNGEVRILSNNSRDWSLAFVDLNLALDADIGNAIAAMQSAVQKTKDDESIKSYLLDEPKITGWNNLTDWAIQVRMSAKTPPGKAADVAIIMRKYALEAIQAAGIPLITR